MHMAAEFSSVALIPKPSGEAPSALAAGYGFGLRWMIDSRNTVGVGHSGGLPGFGSNYVFFPHHGIAVISFANVTYAGTGNANTKVAQLLLEKAALPPRVTPPSPILAARQRQVAQLIQSWDAALATEIAGENFFLDHSREDWIKLSRDTLAKLGTVGSVGEIVPENQLRGTFKLNGENGAIDVSFTLTPEATPKLQHLSLTFVPR
jgi:hypothetical protein